MSQRGGSGINVGTAVQIIKTCSSSEQYTSARIAL